MARLFDSTCKFELFSQRRFHMSNYPMNEHPPLSPPVAPVCDDHLIWETWLSRYYLPTLTVADQIGLFPFLAQSPATAEEVAAGLSLGLCGAETVLALVSAQGFLVQRQGRFYLTDDARTYLLLRVPITVATSCRDQISQSQQRACVNGWKMTGQVATPNHS